MTQISEAQPSKIIGTVITVLTDDYKLESEVYPHSDIDEIMAGHARIANEYHSDQGIKSQDYHAFQR